MISCIQKKRLSRIKRYVKQYIKQYREIIVSQILLLIYLMSASSGH